MQTIRRSQQAKKQGDSGTLPSVEELLEKSVRATGGREAWLKVAFRNLQGEVSINPPNMAGTLEISAKAPDKEAICVRFPQGLFFCHSYDGKTGRQDDSQNAGRPLEIKVLEETRRKADFYTGLNRAKSYSEMKADREDEFDGLKVYVIEGIREDGQKQELYYANDTGLQVGMNDIGVSEQESKTTCLEDHQQVAGPGIKIPAKMRFTMNGNEVGISSIWRMDLAAR